jgi:hypothetical protein
MVAVVLPSDPPPAAMTIEKISAANTLAPAFGGSEDEIDRKGERYALTFVMPSMTYADSMAWSYLYRRGITVVMEVHQPGVVVAAPPAPRVKGAGQAGSLLAIDGLGAGYLLRKGQFLSVITGGQRYLYRAAAAVTANGAGEATVTLHEMLRRSPADNDVVEIAAPKIEGYARNVRDVSVGVDHEVVLEFTVRERE